MHQLCMRVKGGKKLKREQVVVAYGDGRFGSTMKGKRPTPVRKLAKKLAKYVTLVRVDEFRTSRICSNRCGLDLTCHSQEEKKEREDALEWMVGDEDEEDEDGQQERQKEEEKASRQK